MAYSMTRVVTVGPARGNAVDPYRPTLPAAGRLQGAPGMQGLLTDLTEALSAAKWIVWPVVGLALVVLFYPEIKRAVGGRQRGR